jgi:hypothetical protein
MEIVRDVGQFELYEKRVNEEVFLGNIFPRRVFKKRPTSVGFFDCAYMTSGELFRGLKSLCDDFDEDGFVFMMLHPDPKKYYFDDLGYFPAARFSRNDDALVFKEFVLREDGPAGITSAIAFQAYEIVIRSDKGAFVVYGKRADELGVIGAFRTPLNNAEPILKHLNDIIMDCEMAYQEIKNFKPPITKREFVDAWQCT